MYQNLKKNLKTKNKTKKFNLLKKIQQELFTIRNRPSV